MSEIGHQDQGVRARAVSANGAMAHADDGGDLVLDLGCALNRLSRFRLTLLPSPSGFLAALAHARDRRDRHGGERRSEKMSPQQTSFFPRPGPTPGDVIAKAIKSEPNGDRNAP